MNVCHRALCEVLSTHFHRRLCLRGQASRLCEASPIVSWPKPLGTNARLVEDWGGIWIVEAKHTASHPERYYSLGCSIPRKQRLAELQRHLRCWESGTCYCRQHSVIAVLGQDVAGRCFSMTIVLLRWRWMMVMVMVILIWIGRAVLLVGLLWLLPT